MANLKEIRDRIKSVKNTRKITEAMRLVAAAKVRRAQEQVLRSRPFADRLARILENLQSRMGFEDAASSKRMRDWRFSRIRASRSAKGRLRSTCSWACLLYTSPSPRDLSTSRMPSSA